MIKALSFIALFPALTGTASALIPVSDDFNAAALNTNRWIFQKGGRGTFIQSAGRLNYVATSTPSNDDFAVLKLRNNTPGANENWQIILDVSNTANAGIKAGVGISVFNTSDPSDNVNFEFYGAGNNGGFNFIGVTDDIDDATKDVRAFTNVTRGSMLVTFSATSQLFTFSYDPTGSADGYQWRRLCTYSITGVGGTQRGNWRMFGSITSFGVKIYGYSESQALANGKVFMDNFRLKPGL